MKILLINIYVSSKVRYFVLRLFQLVLLSFTLLISSSCEDFVQIDAPRTEIVADNAFSSDEVSLATANGMYNLMLNPFGMYNSGLEVFAGLASDELVNFFNNEDYNEFAANQLLPDNGRLFSGFWQNSYQIISNATAVTEGLRNNTTITPGLRDQLLGEALFIRAYVHFYLVNLFGPVPYVRASSVVTNNTASRESEEQVYEEIIADLLEAQELMADLSLSDSERVRPGLGAVTALLARVYLYSENWTGAEAEATKVIESGDFVLESSLGEVFLATSEEAIWQLTPGEGERTRLGIILPFVFAPNTLFELGPTALRQDLLDAFEPGDNRLTDWVGIGLSGTASYPFKYKNSLDPPVGVGSGDQEHIVMLRLAEQYLIRAETRAQQNNVSEAQEDLNTIRNRAGLENTSADSQSLLLEAIAQERYLELFVEGGHRWLDLKRTQKANEVLMPIKDQWEPTDVLWPIPEIEIFNNTNLLPQNPGY